MKRNDPHRKLWFSLDILGETWKVYLVDPGVVDIDDHEGRCVMQLATIFINKYLDASRKPSVVMHELMHAFNWSIGLEKQSILAPDVDKSEEALVSLLAPVIYASLSATGFLKIPKIPAGW